MQGQPRLQAKTAIKRGQFGPVRDRKKKRIPFLKNEAEKLLITKNRPPKTNRNEPKNEAEKLLKTRTCGKNKAKNKPGHVVEKTGPVKSAGIMRSAKVGKYPLSMKVGINGGRSLPGVACIIFFACELWLAPCLIAQAKASVHSTQRPVARVPFVGCKSDGQLGPIEAPKGKARLLPIAESASSRLAYYKAKDGSGVLAPRAWNCFGTYGSAGAALYVSPSSINSEKLFSSGWKGFTGPAIELALEYGGTSGRFGVARVIARVFPAHRAFLRKIVREGIEPLSAFPSGPYPRDKLQYKSSEVVEFQTPAGVEGLGTILRLQKSTDPVSGVAVLVGQTPDLLLLSVRLSPRAIDLVPVIVQQVERDAVRHND